MLCNLASVVNSRLRSLTREDCTLTISRRSPRHSRPASADGLWRRGSRAWCCFLLLAASYRRRLSSRGGDGKTTLSRGHANRLHRDILL